LPRKERFRNVGAGKGVKGALDRETLRRLYLEEDLSQAEIARRYGCSPQFVSQLLHEYELR
jgi:DNA-binding transcriptional regulator LsrR (DeoR family)